MSDLRTVLGVDPKVYPGLRFELAAAARVFGIREKEHLAAWLAQMAYESSSFRCARESFNYSCEQLLRTFVDWGRMTAPQAMLWGRTESRIAQQRLIANQVYANRMGNGDPASGDGWAFRGGGWIQVTGRDAYQRAGTAVRRDLIARPHQIEEPFVAGLVSAHYWAANGLGVFLDEGGIDVVSAVINTGDPEKVAMGAQARRRLYEAILPVVGEFR